VSDTCQGGGDYHAIERCQRRRRNIFLSRFCLALSLKNYTYKDYILKEGEQFPLVEISFQQAV
jgi:hypothetical protein